MEKYPNYRGEGSLVVLAAGASSRMGFPKALADIGGSSLLNRHIDQGVGLGLSVCVVLGANAELILQDTMKNEAQFVVNQCWEEGQSSSLFKGLKAVRPKTPCFVTPVDCPPVCVSVIHKLWEFLGENRGVVIPTYQNKGGHPVLLSSQFIEAFLRVSPPPPLNQFMKQSGFPVVRVEVDDPDVLRNLNRPKDLKDYVESRSSG